MALNSKQLREALERVIQGSQGNADHIMGEVTKVAENFNALARDVDIIYEILGVRKTTQDDDNEPDSVASRLIQTHTELEDVTANQHHNQAHDQGDHDAAEAGDIAAVGTAGAAGSSVEVPNADHVHAHEAAHINHDTTWAAKGDLIVATANDTAQVLSVGTDAKVLTADSSQTTGLKWSEAAGGADPFPFFMGGAF